MKPALVLVLNAFLHDSRVERHVQTLLKRGHPTTVFALHEEELATHESRSGYRLHRFRLITRPWPKNRVVQGIKYLECILRMTWAGVKLKPELIQANDADTLPIGYLIAKIAKSKLIYDAHELWSEPGISGLPVPLFNVLTRMEAFLARRADAVITVNASLARIMAERMNIPVPTVVRNLPRCVPQLETREPVLRRSIGLTAECPVILYIGALMSDRGLEMLIHAMTFVSPPAVAVFMGPHQCTGYLEKLKARILQANLQQRVHFHAPVPAEEVVRYASDATIGVCPIEDCHLSYRYCLPNKIFECLQAGLPLVVTDLPEMAAIVQDYGVGETFPNGDSMALAITLNKILSSRDVLATYTARARVAARELNWSIEEPRLLSIYDRLSPHTTVTLKGKDPHEVLEGNSIGSLDAGRSRFER